MKSAKCLKNMKKTIALLCKMIYDKNAKTIKRQIRA